MKPGSKEASEAEAKANGSGAAKAKLSSAKPEDVKPAADKSVTSAAVSTGAKSLKMTEKYYARPSDIYECFVVEGKVGSSDNLADESCPSYSDHHPRRRERSPRATPPPNLGPEASSAGSTARCWASFWSWTRISGS